MTNRFVRALGGSTAVAVVALSGVSPALAARHHRSHTRRHSTHATASTGTAETALTGSTLSSAEAAATAANSGATANSASTETDSSLTGAAYEVHITKDDGTHATVIEDSSFAVLATQTASGCHGGAGNGETPLTGSTLTSAETAATNANSGATAQSASTETDSSLTGATYEVHITKADGTHATVIEDSSFTVLATQTAAAHPDRGGDFGGSR